MRYGSVCSGIEAATQAWHPLGWTPAWFSEIEDFPRAVLAHHYPDVPLFGDFTLIRDVPDALDVDVLVGGTPCQAFSVAGLRGSLSDARGNLTLEFIRLADAIDAVRRARGKPPVIIVWENVPGVFSTSDNAFGAFLGGLVGEEAPLVPPRKWTNAGLVIGPQRFAEWRVLDAQFFRVAQRRRRVFVVASARDDLRPGEVLLEPEGVCGDSPPRREARKDLAPTLAARTRGGGGLGTDFDCDGGVIEVAHALRGEGFDASEDGTGRGTPLVPVPGSLNCEPGGIAGTVSSKWSKGSGGPAGDEHYNLIVPEIAPTLDAGMGAKWGSNQWVDAGHAITVPWPLEVADPVSASEGKTYTHEGKGNFRMHNVVEAPLPFDPKQIAHPANRSNPKPGDPCHPLRAVANCEPAVVLHNVVENPVAFSCKDYGADAGDIAPTLRAMGHGETWANGGGQVAVAFDTTQIIHPENRSNPQPGDPCHPLAAAAHAPALATASAVRRLTPRETERLQGFPDDFTLIPVRRVTKANQAKAVLAAAAGDTGFCVVDGEAWVMAPDSPRYKAIGNSMAVPCMAFIGRRIQGGLDVDS